MAKFIYVSSEEARDRLLSLQYEMLKCDDSNRIYVFLNKDGQDCLSNDLKFALSDTLYF